MGRYYFHLRSPYEVLQDEVGMVLPDLLHLAEEAEHVAYTVRKLLGPDDWERDGAWMINVTDDAGVGLFTYPLRIAHEGDDTMDVGSPPAVASKSCSSREKRGGASVPLRAKDRWKHRLPKARR